MMHDNNFRIEKEVKDGQTQLKIEGAITILETAALRTELIAGLMESRELILDLEQVGDCDMFGIQLLHSAGITARDSEKMISVKRISAPVRDAANRIGMSVGDFLFS